MEEAHRLLTERFSLKTDIDPSCRKRRNHSIIDERDVNEWLEQNLSTTNPKNDSSNDDKILDSQQNNLTTDMPTAKGLNCVESKEFKSEQTIDEDEPYLQEAFMEEVMGIVEESEGEIF